MERFSYEISRDEGRTVLTVTGEIDLASAQELRESLHRALVPGGSLVADLSGVTFIDSMGLRMLIEAVNKAAEVDARFLLAAVPDPVGRVFELAGISEIFTIVATSDEALSE